MNDHSICCLCSYQHFPASPFPVSPLFGIAHNNFPFSFPLLSFSLSHFLFRMFSPVDPTIQTIDVEERKEFEEEKISEAELISIDYEKTMHEFKKRSHDIYCKYIQVGSAHEINISSSSRLNYGRLFNNYDKWCLSAEYDTKDKLLHCFDDAKKECGKLLQFTFQRFQKSPLYQKWLQQRLNDPQAK